MVQSNFLDLLITLSILGIAGWFFSNLIAKKMGFENSIQMIKSWLNIKDEVSITDKKMFNIMKKNQGLKY